MKCNACGTENSNLAVYCQRCATRLSNLRSSKGDGTGGVIPYKNPQALVAYYLGVFSAIPFFGLFLGIAAVVLGKLGLDKRNMNPAIKGTVHAWIGIGCGSFFTLLWGGLIAFGVYALFRG